jgi:hypothetical protein
MKTLLGIALLSLISTASMAQTTYDSTATQSTVTPGATPAAPPVGTLSTTRETHAQDAYGNQSSSRSTTYRDSQGVAEDRQTTTTTVAAPPPPPPVTTTTTTTESTTGPQ